MVKFAVDFGYDGDGIEELGLLCNTWNLSVKSIEFTGHFPEVTFEASREDAEKFLVNYWGTPEEYEEMVGELMEV